MSIKRMVIGMGMILAMFTGRASAQTPDIFLSVSDTSIYPGDVEGRYLTVRVNNPSVKYAGYKVGLFIENPQAINFTYFDVDTVLPDTVIFQICSPAPCHLDTTVTCPDSCFNYFSQVITAGTRSQGWDYVEGRRYSETYLQVTGIMHSNGNGPVMQPGNGVLFRVPLNIFPIDDSVSLSERQVQISISPVGDLTHFSDSTGNIVYRVGDTLNTLSITSGTVFIPYSIKGDINFNGFLDGSDVVRLINYAFLGINPPVPSVSVGDVNCDAIIDGSDVVKEINKVFLGFPFPC